MDMDKDDRRSYNVKDLVKLIFELPEGVRRVLYEQLGVEEIKIKKRNILLQQEDRKD